MIKEKKEIDKKARQTSLFTWGVSQGETIQMWCVFQCKVTNKLPSWPSCLSKGLYDNDFLCTKL